SMPSVPGRYSRPISFHSPADCGIPFLAMPPLFPESVSVERRREGQRGGGRACNLRFAGDEFGGRARRDVALENAAMAQARGAEQPSAGPGARERGALRPWNDAVGTIMDDQRRRLQARRQARNFELEPAQAEALFDR